MPTARELGPEGWEPYLEAARRRTDRSPKTKTARSERERLLEKAREAASALKRQFKAKRVILFGSIAHDLWDDQESDLDLAVEGLPLKKYWQAWKVVEDIISDRPVDLVDIETATESLKDSIERYGVEL